MFIWNFLALSMIPVSPTVSLSHQEASISLLSFSIRGQTDWKLQSQKTKIMASGPITSWQIGGEAVETVTDFIFRAPKSLQMVTAAMKLNDAPSKKSYDQPRQHIKKQRHYFAHKGPSSQSYGFSSSHAQMWELDHKECWALKNWCF